MCRRRPISLSNVGSVPFHCAFATPDAVNRKKHANESLFLYPSSANPEARIPESCRLIRGFAVRDPPICN